MKRNSHWNDLVGLEMIQKNKKKTSRERLSEILLHKNVESTE